MNILSFKGWNNERIVTQIPDWGLNGRVIYVCEADSKAKKERVKEILDMVDRDLGFAARTELKPKTLVHNLSILFVGITPRWMSFNLKLIPSSFRYILQ